MTFPDSSNEENPGLNPPPPLIERKRKKNTLYLNHYLPKQDTEIQMLTCEVSFFASALLVAFTKFGDPSDISNGVDCPELDTLADKTMGR